MVKKTVVFAVLALLFTLSVVLSNGVEAAFRQAQKSFTTEGLETEFADIEKEMEDVQVLRHKKQQPKLTLKHLPKLEAIPHEDEDKLEYSTMPVHSKYVHLPQFVDHSVTKLQDLLNEKLRTEDEKTELKQLKEKKAPKKASQVIAEVAGERLTRAKEAKKIVRRAAWSAFFGSPKKEKKVEKKPVKKQTSSDAFKPLLRIIIEKRKAAKALSNNKQAAKIIENLKRAADKKKTNKTDESIRKIIHKVVSGKVFAGHFPKEYKVAQKNLKVLIRTLIRYTKSQPSKAQGCIATLLRNLRFIRENLRRVDASADKELTEYYVATLKRSKEVSKNFNDAIVKLKPILDAARSSLKGTSKCGKPKVELPKRTVVVRVAKKNVKKCEEKKQQEKLNLFHLIRVMKALRQKKEKARKGCQRVKSSIKKLAVDLSKNASTAPLVKRLEKLKKATWKRVLFVKLLKALLRHAQKIPEPAQKKTCLDGLLNIKKLADSVSKYLPKSKSVKKISKARKAVNKLVKKLVKVESKLTPAQQVHLCATIKQLKQVNKQLKQVNAKPVAKLLKLVKKQVAKVAPQNASIQAQLKKVQKKVKTAQKTLKKDAKKSAATLSKKIASLVKNVTVASTKVKDAKVQQKLNKVAVKLQKIQPKTNAMKPKAMKKAIAALKKVEAKLNSPALDKAIKTIEKRVRLIAQSAPSKLQIKVEKTKQTVTAAIKQVKAVAKDANADAKKTVSKLVQNLRVVRRRCGTVPNRAWLKALQKAKETVKKIQLPAPVADKIKSALKTANKVEKKVAKVAEKKQEKAKTLIKKLAEKVKSSPKAATILKKLTKLEAKAGKKVSSKLLIKIKAAVVKAAPAQKSLVKKLVRVEKNLNKRLATPKPTSVKKAVKASKKLTKALKSQVAKGKVSKSDVKPIVKELKLVARAASKGCIHTAKRLTIDLRRKIAGLSSKKVQKLAIKLQARVTKVIVSREILRAKLRVSKLIRMFKRSSKLSCDSGKETASKTIKLLRVFRRYAKTADATEVNTVIQKILHNARKVDASMVPRVTRITARIRIFLSHRLSLKLNSAQIVFKQKISNLMNALRFIHEQKGTKPTILRLLGLLTRLRLSAGKSKKDVKVVSKVQQMVKANVPVLDRRCQELIQRFLQVKNSKPSLPSIPLGKKSLKAKYAELKKFALSFLKQLRKLALADKKSSRKVLRVRRLIRLLVKTAAKPYSKYDRVLSRLYKKASSFGLIRKQALGFLDVFSSHVSLLRAFLPARKVKQLPLAVVDARRKIKIAILKLRLVRRALQDRKQRRALRKILRGLYTLRIRVRRSGAKFTRLANRLLRNVAKLDSQIRTEVGEIVEALLQQAVKAQKSLPKRRTIKRSKAVKVLLHALRLQRRSLSRGDEKRRILSRIIRLLRRVKKSSRCQERNQRLLAKIEKSAAALSGEDVKVFQGALSRVRAEVLGEKKRVAKKAAPVFKFKNPLKSALNFILSEASSQKKRSAPKAHKFVDFSSLKDEVKKLL